MRLEDFRGRKLLVYFYPEADTPGCTTQSCDVRDHREEFANLGLDVVGISPDEPPAQLAFDEKYSLGFPLLSDPDHAVSEAWGTWGEKTELRKDLRRDDPILVPRGRSAAASSRPGTACRRQRPSRRRPRPCRASAAARPTLAHRDVRRLTSRSRVPSLEVRGRCDRRASARSLRTGRDGGCDAHRGTLHDRRTHGRPARGPSAPDAPCRDAPVRPDRRPDGGRVRWPACSSRTSTTRRRGAARRCAVATWSRSWWRCRS